MVCSFGFYGVFQEYYIFFVKCIDEIKTSEKITICLRSNGVLHAFASYMIGEFNEENVDGIFDYNAVKQQVIERMDELCSSKDGNYNVVHDVELVLTKETKNKIVLLATDSRGRYDKETGQRINGDYVKFIIR